MNSKSRTVLGAFFSKFSQLPFLFIGSGFSRRYLGLPNWEGLLRVFAERVYPDNPLAFEVFAPPAENLGLPEVASRLEKEYNQHWLKEAQFASERRELQDRIKRGVSPFKLAVSRYVASAKKQKEKHLLDELACLVNVGKRSVAGVITTNYDQLVESVFNGYDVFVGQEQLLFSETQGVAEVYKIHGCCTQPESLVINAKDYEAFNERNAYLAAKMLTLFVEHPIIFIGYSINDPNVKGIIKAIAGCLSQTNLERLKNRFVFIEYSDKPLEEPIIRDHTLTFDTSGQTLEMIRIQLHDYLPLYSELLSRKYEYNPKLLRQLKRDIYQLITTNKPVDHFKLIDIEDDKSLDNVSVLAGVGVLGGNGGGHNIPEAESLFYDIVLDNGNFDLKSLVEGALSHLLKHHSNSLPINKYISAYVSEFTCDPPESIVQHAPQSLDAFLNQSLRARRAKKTFRSFDDLKKNDPRDEKIIEQIPLLEERALLPTEIGGYLKDYLERNPDALTESAPQTLKTNLKRVIKIYDWLKYGKEKGASIT